MSVVTFSNGLVSDVTVSTLTGTSVSNLTVKFSGFSNTPEGKLVGPNGSIMDTEEFLAGAEIWWGGVSRNFNIVTQKYGKAMVEYGQKSTSTFPPQSSGRYNNICSQDGIVYINFDTTTYSSTSGFSNATISTGFSYSDVTLVFRVYDTLEFEDQMGEVSFDLTSVTVSVTERKLRAELVT